MQKTLLALITVGIGFALFIDGETTAMLIRKINRRSGPARVTQRGTTKTYSHPDHATLQRKQNRYYLEKEQLNVPVA